MIWLRRDWDEPVGWFDFFSAEVRVSYVEGKRLAWFLYRVPCLFLSRKAALLVLQGMKINDLLIPNAEFKFDSVGPGFSPHLALWSKWDPSDPIPALRDLLLAGLGEMPEDLNPQKIFFALVEEAVQLSR